MRDEIIGLFTALERIMRAGMNGHPAGHDANAAGIRALDRAWKAGVVDRRPNLQCNCTPCAMKRKLASEAPEATPDRP